MKIEKEMSGNLVILRVLEKQIDTHHSSELKKELLAHIVEDSPNMIIDLGSVEYMDSSGLGALLFGRRQAERFMGKFGLINLTPKVIKLIAIAHLTTMLAVFESEEKALQAFKL